jgi:Ca2+-binding RTX toxin-like protein
MANYTYLVPPFSTTTFTVPDAGTDDGIIAQGLFNFTINGNGGNDDVATAGGDDTITTTTGNDVIVAGHGNNTVTAGDGVNAVTTGSGNDTITTGSGADTVKSGSGNDTITTGSRADTVNSGSGNDTITTGAGRDIIRSGSGGDSIDAGSGNDNIRSGGGDDIVNAGTGKDKIVSGGGIDLLTGGGGHDTFVYNKLASAMLGADTIADFSTDSATGAGDGDRLVLKKLVGDFTNLPGDITLADLVASGHLDFSAGGGGTVLGFDSNGAAAGGSAGVLVTLVGVSFTSESNSALAFFDNIVVA